MNKLELIQKNKYRIRKIIPKKYVCISWFVGNLVELNRPEFSKTGKYKGFRVCQVISKKSSKRENCVIFELEITNWFHKYFRRKYN